MALSSAQPKWRIFVVDHHGLIRQGLKEVLASQPEMEICGEAEDAGSAFNLIMKLTPDLVTTEISLPGSSGLELIKSIRGLDRNIGVLVISMSDELLYTERALRAGAHGFFHKHASIAGLPDAVRSILSGKLVVPPAAAQHMLNALARGSRSTTSGVENLTDRELEVGNQIGTGSTTREIAGRMGVSVKTIETHRSHIKRKLGLANGTRLLQFWSQWACRAEPQSNQLELPELAAPECNGDLVRTGALALTGSD